MPKTYVPTSIGTILKKLRSEKNISSRRLGEKLDISREMSVAVENNKTNPSLHNLISILDFYNCEILVVKKDTNEIVDTIKKI
jgi:transcriptional regulator with XRE-family HTH domain